MKPSVDPVKEGSVQGKTHYSPASPLVKPSAGWYREPTMTVREILCGVRSLLMPAACVGCDVPLEEADPPLCSPCRQKLAGSRSVWSRGEGRFFDRAISSFPYEGVAKTLIGALKYHQRLGLAPFLGGLLAETVISRLGSDSADAVVPVPLHPARRRERTFNQAEALAELLAERLDLPCRRDLLSRLKPTLPQTELTRAQRQANMQGAFLLKPDPLVRSARLLLVDDVFTTGATAEACARRLKEAGAASVIVVTLAHG